MPNASDPRWSPPRDGRTTLTEQLDFEKGFTTAWIRFLELKRDQRLDSSPDGVYLRTLSESQLPLPIFKGVTANINDIQAHTSVYVDRKDAVMLNITFPMVSAILRAGYSQNKLTSVEVDYVPFDFAAELKRLSERSLYANIQELSELVVAKGEFAVFFGSYMPSDEPTDAETQEGIIFQENETNINRARLIFEGLGKDTAITIITAVHAHVQNFVTAAGVFDADQNPDTLMAFDILGNRVLAELPKNTHSLGVRQFYDVVEKIMQEEVVETLAQYHQVEANKSERKVNIRVKRKPAVKFATPKGVVEVELRPSIDKKRVVTLAKSPHPNSWVDVVEMVKPRYFKVTLNAGSEVAS